MFRLIESSSGQIQNMLLVHLVSARITGSHTVYKIIFAIKMKQYGTPQCVHINFFAT